MTGWIASRRAREVLSVAADSDVCAVQAEEDMYREREEVEWLLAEVDRELAAEERVAVVRLDRSFMDARRAGRARRRAGRLVLRGLPGRVDVDSVIEEEAA